MACLVTGGTGYIGMYILRRLARLGEQIVVYDIAPDTGALERRLGPDELARVKVVRGDVMDLPFLMHTARQHGVDRVVHLAYVLGEATEVNPHLGSRINIEGTNNVFEMAAILGIRRVVWASSITVFGPKSVGPDGVVANDAPFDPTMVYGACKVLNEVTARRYAVDHGLEPVGLRLPLVYGPGALRGWTRLLMIMIDKLVKGQPARSPNSDLPFSWTYVDDIAEAFVLGTQAPKPRTLAFNLGGEVCDTNGVVKKIAARFPGAKITPLSPAGLEFAARYDDHAAAEELGWKFRRSLDEGIEECIAYYRTL